MMPDRSVDQRDGLAAIWGAAHASSPPRSPRLSSQHQQRGGLRQRIRRVLQIALKAAHLPAQLGLLGLTLPAALGRPVVGVLAGATPGLDLLGVQAALAAVLAELHFVRRGRLVHRGELVPRAPPLGAGGTVGQQPALVLRVTTPVVKRASLMPSSASSVGARLCGDSIFRSIASLRSLEYLGTGRSRLRPRLQLQSQTVEVTTSLTLMERSASFLGRALGGHKER